MLSSNIAVVEKDPFGIKEILAAEYSSADLGAVIPIIYSRCAIAEVSLSSQSSSTSPSTSSDNDDGKKRCDSWYAMNTIAEISSRFLQVKWKISVYICKAEHNVYVVAFYAINPTKASDKYYVDKYGNCYENEMNFLLSYFGMHFQSNIRAYRPYTQPKGKTLNAADVQKFNLLKCFSNGITRLFGSRGTQMMNEFKSAFEDEHDAKINLIEIKVVFPLFRLLLRNENHTVRFKVKKLYTIDIDGNSNEAFEVCIIINRCLYIIKNIHQIKTFSEFDEIVTKAMNIDSIVYNEQCKQIINYLKSNNKIQWENGSTDLESFTRYINQRYGWCKMLGYGCLNIASRMLDLQNWGPLKLSRLRCIIFWIQYKCTLDYRNIEHQFFDSIVSNDVKIRNLCNQFKKMLEVVRDCETSTDHQFTNNFTKAYHVNKHFDGLKEFHSHFNNKLTQEEIQQLQSVTITRRTDITTIDQLYLKACSKYYLFSMADFIFGDDIYNYLGHEEFFVKSTFITNIASKGIKGVKKRYNAQGVVGDPFVATIHVKTY